MPNKANTLPVFSPFDRSLIAELPLSSWEEIDSALDLCDAVHRNQSQWLPPYRRIEILERIAVLMKERSELLIDTAVKEGGKPLQDTRVELERAIYGVKLAAQSVMQLHGEEISMGATSSSTSRIAWSTLEPIGTVVSLSAFNHPINLIVHQSMTAIAAGCPVIVKPAPATPLSCIAIMEIVKEAGLDERYCKMIICSNENAERLACDKRVAYLSFIGSAKVGWYLRSKLHPGTRCALEHGGAAPIIIDESAARDSLHLDEMINSITKGAFYHAGQVCVSTQRLFAPDSILDVIVDKLCLAAKSLSVGDPALESTDIGPLIEPEHVNRMENWLKEACNEGGTIVGGGKRISNTCFEPTIVMNPGKEAKVSREEIFGPVLSIYSYKNLDEAIELANSIPYAFHAAIFTKELDTALYAGKRLNATAVMINDHTAFRVDWMPFGGREQSGLGMGGIAQSVKEMSREKLFIIKSKAL